MKPFYVVLCSRDDHEIIYVGEGIQIDPLSQAPTQEEFQRDPFLLSGPQLRLLV
jgi:hypothetical protein